MNRENFNKRLESPHTCKPMQVRDEIIYLCRTSIEGIWKRRIRNIIMPWVIMRLNLSEAGEGFQWGRDERISGARFGRYSSIGRNGSFSGPVVVGDLTMLSSEVQIIGQDHIFDDISRPTRINFPKFPRPVTIIESDVWIGARATIMEGVTIGRGSIIGSGSIVTKNIPPYSIAVGSPARVIHARFNEIDQLSYDKLMYDSIVSHPEPIKA